MERFLELANKLDCGYYSCNFLDKRGKTVLPTYRIMTFGDTKVAFIGVTTPSSLSSSTPTFFQDGNGKYIYSFCEDLTGEKLYKQIQKTVDKVRKQVDYVMLVAHLGVNGSQERWSSVAVAQNVSGVDVIIDGHSHEVNPATIVQNKLGKDVFITQTGTKLKNIGQLTIGVDGKVTTKLISGLQNKDTDLEKVIAQEKADFEEVLKQPLGEAVVPLYVNNPETGMRMVRNHECNMGSLVADAMRKVLNSDIGIINGGNIRKDIPQGIFT
jgi:2',3'-cyclic-nucleotide 2'-phosphodiesterase (5'-nucleotidase family)